MLKVDVRLLPTPAAGMESPAAPLVLQWTVLVIIVLARAAVAGDLNDTGQSRCYDSDGNVRSCLSRSASDDARFGRDAAAAGGSLRKRGGGIAGFDFTKIANDGRDLPPDAPLDKASGDWACTRDNLTGLIWEVKTSSASDLRYGGHQYGWYNTNSLENGGNAGNVRSPACFPTLPLCNTQEFIEAVNETRLCGYSDWRLPTPRELRSIITYADAGGQISVDPAYFPNTRVGRAHWTAHTYAPDPRAAWVVEIGEFDGGGGGHFHSKLPNLGIEGSGEEVTILVRGPQSDSGSGPCSAGTPVANVPVATPTRDFIDHGDGTATHLVTGLMWKRCAEGASGTGCGSGQAITMTWDTALTTADAATFAGYDDWRLPNVKELHSIVETCGFDPAINTIIFPNVPRPSFGSVFFTSTTWTLAPSQQWIFVFDRGGGVATGKPKQGGLFVRLVRGGASSAAYDVQNPPKPRRRSVRR